MLNLGALSALWRFTFVGVVRQSCIGTLSDGTSTIEVVVVDCAPGILPTAIVNGGPEIGAVTGG